VVFVPLLVVCFGFIDLMGCMPFMNLFKFKKTFSARRGGLLSIPAALN